MPVQPVKKPRPLEYRTHGFIFNARRDLAQIQHLGCLSPGGEQPMEAAAQIASPPQIRLGRKSFASSRKQSEHRRAGRVPFQEAVRFGAGFERSSEAKMHTRSGKEGF